MEYFIKVAGGERGYPIEQLRKMLWFNITQFQNFSETSYLGLWCTLDCFKTFITVSVE